VSTLLDISPTFPMPPIVAPHDRCSARATIDPQSPAFIACRDITRTRARNFYLGLRLAPEPRRSALLALYTWMRHADDLADADGPNHTPTTRLAALGELRARTIAALAGSGGADAPAHCAPWWAAFLATAGAHALPATIFTHTLDALEADAGGVDHQTTADLAHYCDRVAGTVAIACVRIWGVRRADLASRVMHLAILRARAVQLTNILRDLREDMAFTPRRSYFPRESYLAHNVSPGDVLTAPDAAGSAALLSDWIAQARVLYGASRELESLIDPSCARVCWALAAVYESLLDSIERQPAMLARQRISVPRARKFSIAVAGWLGVGLPG